MSSSTASSIVGHGEPGAYLQQSMGERQDTPWTGRQSIVGQNTNSQPHTPKGNQERPINLLWHVFGLWEEARVPGENPLMHGENRQTPARKSPGQESNPRQQCYQLRHRTAPL
ncbi:hypothetical protein AMECASPLE_029966 [Ameca splendens]|uniref:Uncharacterized protein n=1 Tax=Ameca splendens TaxID=208324 RepID=A0ABV0XV59_9TELE